MVIIRGDGGEAEVSADKRIPIVTITQGVIREVTSEQQVVERPIAEDLSVDLVVQRLLKVWQGDTASEAYGYQTLMQTLKFILENE